MQIFYRSAEFLDLDFTYSSGYCFVPGDTRAQRPDSQHDIGGSFFMRFIISPSITSKQWTHHSTDGFRGCPGTRPFSVQLSSFTCNFRESWQNNMLVPLSLEVDVPI